MGFEQKKSAKKLTFLGAFCWWRRWESNNGKAERHDLNTKKSDDLSIVNCAKCCWGFSEKPVQEQKVGYKNGFDGIAKKMYSFKDDR